MTLNSASYTDRRGQIEDYFDRTAVKAWEQLTSDAPVGRIRTTVRAGRDKMRATLLSWMPEDLHGRRVLDAGCGTGALAVEAARRGVVPGVANLEQLAPSCAGLNVAQQTRSTRSDVVLVLCRGFAGTNAAVLLRAVR